MWLDRGRGVITGRARGSIANRFAVCANAFINVVCLNLFLPGHLTWALSCLDEFKSIFSVLRPQTPHHTVVHVRSCVDLGESGQTMIWLLAPERNNSRKIMNGLCAGLRAEREEKKLNRNSSPLCLY